MASSTTFRQPQRKLFFASFALKCILRLSSTNLFGEPLQRECINNKLQLIYITYQYFCKDCIVIIAILNYF